MPNTTNIDDMRTWLEARYEAGETVYALLEGAGKRRKPIIDQVFEGSENLSVTLLYYDTDFEPVADVGPLLVEVPRQSRFTDWMLHEGVSLGAGIFIASPCDYMVTTRHLRGIIEIILPNRNLALFRFHDPLVLDRYVNCVGDAALRRLLGPLSAMAWPEELLDGGVRWRTLWQPASSEPGAQCEAPEEPMISWSAEDMAAFEEHDQRNLAKRLLHSFPAN